jgi:hypothetical protein
VVELVVGGALLFAALVFLGVFGFMVSLFFTLFVLPFQLLGLLFKGFAGLLLLPILLVLGFVGLMVFAAGVIGLFTPLLPLVLIGLGVWWLVKRERRAATTH